MSLHCFVSNLGSGLIWAWVCCVAPRVVSLRSDAVVVGRSVCLLIRCRAFVAEEFLACIAVRYVDSLFSLQLIWSSF